MNSDDETYRMEVVDAAENTDSNTTLSIHSEVEDAPEDDEHSSVSEATENIPHPASASTPVQEVDLVNDEGGHENQDDDNVEEEETNQNAEDLGATNMPSAATKPTAAAADMSAEDDGQMCTICFEPWTSSSEHRLVSLRCGHLFGRSCITKWLKGQGSRCPQCNARARKSEIRPIYARTLKVLDTSERDRALRELELEIERRRQCEKQCAQLRMKLSLLNQDNEMLKNKLMETQLMLNESRFFVKHGEKLSNPSSASKSSYTLVKNVEIRGGGCRIMDGSELLGMILISQPSTNVLFPGYGLKKVSFPDMRVQEFVCLHQKPIKDVSFHPHDSLVLTASLDRTVKLTNCVSNSVVQTYNLNGDAWSCQWDLDDPCYFYAGIQNGAVQVFDIRVTDRHVCELEGLGQRSPVVSLSYLKRKFSGGHGKCGPVIGQLASCCFYEKLGSTAFNFHPLPLEGRVMSLSCDSATCHLLASFRPSQKYPKVTHMLCEMCFENNIASCNLIYAMSGGCAHAQLTRSKLFPHPDCDSSSLVCSGDEEAKGALIWDASTGTLIDTLKADCPVTDLMSFRDHHRSVLTTLTDKNLRVYNWTPS